MHDDAYAPHEALVAPARKHPALWRLVTGSVLIVIVYFALTLQLMSFLGGLGLIHSSQEFLLGQSPLGMLALLGSFLFLTLGVVLALRGFQKRGLGSLIGQPRIALDQFRRVMLALLVLAAAVAILPPYDMGAPLRQNMPALQWLFLLPFALAGVLAQVSAEEILFRGYLQQSLAARFRSPLIWMTVPSALFALGHYLPNEAGENALMIAVWSGVFGLLMADITARAGTLGPAVALHFFNNAVAMTLVSAPGSLDSLALFLLPYGISDTGLFRGWLYVDFAVMFVGWLTARLAIRR